MNNKQNHSQLKIFIIFNLMFLFLVFNALAIDKNIPKTSEEWDKAWASLNWKKGPSVVNYNKANSKINISSNFEILEGTEAHQMLYWLNGVDFSYVDVYAMGQNSEQYLFYYTDSGYVKTDDWTDVDPDKFIKEMIENYKASNSTRQQNGQATVKDVTWKKKPYLDGTYNSVYYAFNVTWSDNSSTVEGTAIILGKEGYTTASYVGGTDGYQEQLLLNLSKIHKFNTTKEYKDWKSGDKVAAAGIGALLATTLGVKALKPGIIAAGLLLFKKFWFIIVLPFIWLGKLFTGSDKKKKK
tara:strand:+ start:2338 stop:3228 length:891 start_codon:yes stop_codon:yes gene_type:complete